ncbi:chemotaxis protein CheY [Paenibacillus swuensis]|uniref:Chemotaxis protein CheY n=2 Tax=Paenibacillus swuensis TaxID=1178515 RepID=A0A172THH6_9BACL|nr:chemotaxis protein CheY [Paenibacillus swuensis]
MIGDMLSMYLAEEGYEVRKAATGTEGIEVLREWKPDILLLDLMLPDMSGITLCEKIRQFTSVPILMVSMRTDVVDRVNALVAGADDYLCKPFSMRELTARVGALLRRSQIRPLTETPLHFSHEDIQSRVSRKIELDPSRRAVYVKGEFIETTFSEFELMRLFHANPERVYSREELINTLRGIDSFVTNRSIDVHITNLRKKIEEDPKEPKYIRTVWGVGYKFMFNHS